MQQREEIARLKKEKHELILKNYMDRHGKFVKAEAQRIEPILKDNIKEGQTIYQAVKELLSDKVKKQRVTATYCILRELKTIDVTNARLGSIPKNFLKDADNVVFVNLTGNKLSTLPENMFKGLSKLGSVSLIDNSFTHFPESAFQGTSLRAIALADNLWRMDQREFEESHPQFKYFIW